MAYPSEYYTKAQEIIDKRRFENSLKAEKRLREVRSKIPEKITIQCNLIALNGNQILCTSAP